MLLLHVVLDYLVDFSQAVIKGVRCVHPASVLPFKEHFLINAFKTSHLFKMLEDAVHICSQSQISQSQPA